MASSNPTSNLNDAIPPRSKEANLWANLPPLHTIKPEELIRYQIVDWDYNNPHHPHYLEGHLLVKSLFRRDHYYWIACSNPLPKDNSQKAPPAIAISPPTSLPTPTNAVAQPPTSSWPFSESNFASIRAESQEQQAAMFSASSSTPTTVSDPASVMPNLPIAGMSSSFGSPSGMSYTRPESIPTRSFVPSSSSLHSIHSSHFGSSTPTSSLGNHRHFSNESSSLAPSPSMSASQQKRTLKSKQQEGRNVRPELGRGPLNADGRPIGVEKPADGWLNLGTMSWHYRNPSDRDGKS